MQRTMHKTTYVLMAVAGICILLLTQWQTHSQTSVPSPCRDKKLALPLKDLDPVSDEAFFKGCDEFMEEETPDEGLGPVFNGKSCAECHSVPSVGGFEPNVGVARETRIGRLVDGVFDPLDGKGPGAVNKGGGLLQQRAINLSTCKQLTGEIVPQEATIVSLRNTTPLFGAGLIEAIPEKTITDRALINGGRPNRVFNPDPPPGQSNVLGRFGWKAQVATLKQFAGDAYLNEMGITNPSFPDENLPQGEPIPPGCDLAPTKENPNGLEDDGSGVQAFADFMKFLAPLEPQRTVTGGLDLFSSTGCANCHIPTMMTGSNAVEALNNKPVHLYSDLLLHDIGTDDGIVQGLAQGNEFRTAPLWGLSRRDRFMHDAKSNKIEDAILRHGKEALTAREKFESLSPGQRAVLLAFLGSL